MPRVENVAPEDFRRVLKEKALNHSLFYLKLGAGVAPEHVRGSQRRSSASQQPRAAGNTRSQRVSELVRRFEPAPMQYLRPPRAASPDDITSSDEDDRAAVRRRSRDCSDDSAVEVDVRRRHSNTPRHERTLLAAGTAELGRRGSEDSPRARCERTLLAAGIAELGRRGSEDNPRARCVRTPSVVVSDYSDGVAVGASEEEVNWLRSRSLSADSACSSCSTLSSRDDDEFESPTLPKKMINAD